MGFTPKAAGVNKTSQALNTTGILDALNNFYDQNWDKDKHVRVHPLYAELQRRSPLNILLKQYFELKDHEYDLINKPLDGKTFYRKYMSKSLPCVLRKEASKDAFYIELKDAGSQREVDNKI